MLPTLPPRLALFSLVLVAALSASAPVRSANWIHWRGPEQTGQSKEVNLPGDFEPRQKAAGNVIWQQPFGGRSAPLVMGGKLYIIQGTGAALSEGEQVVCVDEASGKKLWDYRVNVYHTDIVSSRLGWTTLTADPAAGYVYAHTTAGELLCLDKEGKKVWSRQLTEEFGRVTGYGGRIVSPIFDSGLVVVGVASSSWGDQARGLNRFLAFDGKTGQVVWITGVGDQLYGTYYSSPVVAVINGQRLLIAGRAPTARFHALKVRTGEEVWSYEFGAGVINGSPVVSGTMVFCTHGEENPEGGPVGRVVCVDAGQVTAKQPKLVWDSYKRVYKKNRNQSLSDRFGLASAALADGLLYCPTDSGELCCFRAKDGELLWKYRYATEVRGSPLVADGKLYIFDVKAKMIVLTLKGEEAPDPNDTFDYRFPGAGGLLNETNGTPIAVNGRLYFNTRTDLFCVGDSKAKVTPAKYAEMPGETPFKEGATAGVRLFPADVNAKPGEKVQFQVVHFDENGREVQDARGGAKYTWTLPQPPVPKGAKGAPPALQGKIENGLLALDPPPSQQGYVELGAGGFKARARVRVVPQLPYSQNFDKVPAGAAPGGWVNANGKFLAKQLQGGNVVLSKLNDNPRPPLARANGYITGPDATDYTIQADVFATLAREKLPDLGLVNCRYTLTLDGKIDPATGKLSVRLVTWEARPRIDQSVSFDWKADTWYTMKFTVEQTEKGAVLRGKVWPKGEQEPEKWTIEFTDPSPNRVGAAALYGYVPNVTALAGGEVQPGSEIYYDNLSVTPNKK